MYNIILINCFYKNVVFCVQKTATKAVVKIEKNQSLGENFLLLVELAEIHVPRMWVEEHPQSGSKVIHISYKTKQKYDIFVVI